MQLPKRWLKICAFLLSCSTGQTDTSEDSVWSTGAAVCKPWSDRWPRSAYRWVREFQGTYSSLEVSLLEKEDLPLYNVFFKKQRGKKKKTQNFQSFERKSQPVFKIYTYTMPKHHLTNYLLVTWEENVICQTDPTLVQGSTLAPAIMAQPDVGSLRTHSSNHPCPKCLHEIWSRL